MDRDMKKLNYQYIRKNQSRAEARLTSALRKPVAMIWKDDLAQIVAACIMDPYEVRKGKRHLFEDPIYSKIFNEQRSVKEYLIYYWLGQAVFPLTYKDLPRGYAKWLVINFASALLAETLLSKDL